MSKARVLIIEDDCILAASLADCLRKNDYEVLLTEDGRTGIERARTQLPDIILCDVVIPLTDGFGVLAALKDSIDTMHIPIVLMTMAADETGKSLAFTLGASEYLAKPMPLKGYLSVIEERLAGAAALRSIPAAVRIPGNPAASLA